MKITHFILNIKYGLIFLFGNIKDNANLLFYKLKTMLYYMAPSTVRFKLNTSVFFLRFKNKFITKPTFICKRIMFNFNRVVSGVFIDIKLYFSNIFIRHWKLILFVSILCVTLILVDYLGHNQTTFLYNTGLLYLSNQDKVYDLYLSLAGILATFLGLYFTASSIIAQTVYSKVNGGISQLLNSIRISNIYIKSIIMLLAFILVSIFCMTHNVYIGFWNPIVVSVFSLVSIISFWELAQYLFLFFNPANLVREHILPKLQKQLNLVTKKSVYKYDANFQNSAYINACNIFDSYDSIVEFAANQELLQLKVISDILRDALSSLAGYVLIKHKIPSDSCWFPQEYSFNKYTDVADIDINLSKNTGTIAGQTLVRNTMWMEQRYLNIINKCFHLLYTKKELKTYYDILLYVNEVIKRLNAQGKTDEVFFIIQNLFSPFDKDLQYNDGLLSYIADAYISVFIELSLSFNTHIVTSNINNITIHKLLKSNFIYEKLRLPTALKPKLEEIINKLQFEKEIENQIITSDWHAQQLLSKECDKFLFEWYDNILAFSLKELKKYRENSFIKTHADISIFVFNRACELKHKLMNCFDLLCDKVGEKSAKIEFEQKLQKFNTDIINFIITLAPYLEVTDEKLPDSIGFAYVTLYGELEQNIFEEKACNTTTIIDMLNTLILLALLQINHLKNEATVLSKKGTGDKSLQFKLNSIFAKLAKIYIEIMDIFGYLYLFDDVYENRNIRVKLIPIFDKFIATIGLTPIIASIGANNYLRFSSQMGHNLKVAASDKLRELGLVWESVHFGNIKKDIRKPEFKSKLLEYVCRMDSRLWQCPDGYSIFVCAYLLDKCNEQQKEIVLSDWKTSSLYREYYDD